ncbi:ABC-type sugar transport system, periplasmic component, contains N-terminal xre family HTH domain [Marinomonas fungiae]|uniref:ABC-type sugar transport system, periplasmic component, contains N-terminal xre family HTH domain n=1 Tax=Marinomonas fungiae TaxID=1137284 RepID=A0A0K6IGP6_9GAMM|nr:ABC-type sugar transport system, periplasmic component, contains N-terminal xre family HTH domain [Marinomonas fungiae]
MFTLCILISRESYALDLSLESYNASINSAIETRNQWQGPLSGPTIADQKRIVFVASDLRNDGVNSVAKGMTEALKPLNWNMRLLDGHGSTLRQSAAINQAIALRPDGIVLGGIDAKSNLDSLKIAKSLGITVVGWHSANRAGAIPELNLFTNITTDAEEVGRKAAELAIVTSSAKAKVVIFTDSNYSIAMLKARSMATTIEACANCSILSLEDIPLHNISSEMPKAIARLLKAYPDQITHFLVINDLYIDFAVPTLNRYGIKTQNISAGDGSREAYQRIKSGNHQLATVPEPLFMQGWQIVDELNRAFNGLKESGFLAPVHIVVKDNIHEVDIESGVYDPKNHYRTIYQGIWQ